MQPDMDDPSGDFYPESQSLSPQASTDEKSLHGNWQRNRESLQKRLSIRRPVDDLVNTGIMMSPLKTPPCYAERMRQLERAKTSDALRHKIQQRPDAQFLVDRHILPEWPPETYIYGIGGSPQIFEQQQLQRRNELKSSLSAKLEQRPGSLEMAEKGLLPLAPPMQTLLRDGAIAYPRVDETVPEADELGLVSAPLLAGLGPAPVSSMQTTSCVVTSAVLPPAVSASPEAFYPTAPSVAPSIASSSSSSSSYRRSRSRRAGSGPGTSKVGNFVFHMYTPPSKTEAVSPQQQPTAEEEAMVVTPNTARQIQQAEYLRLQESENKQNVLMQQLVNDIRARGDGGSPMKVQRSEPGHMQLQPAVTAASASGFVSFSGLAALNVQQLKEECRRYKVPRTGNKMNLIRNLEPFQQEIMRKYVSATTSPTLGSPAGSQATMAAPGLLPNGLMEDQAMRHSSSAPQLNLATKMSTGGEEMKPGDSPQGQWAQQQQPATLILLNQTGPMTLQSVLVTPQGVVAPPPPPPPPPPVQVPVSLAGTQALLLRHTSQPATSPEQQQAFPEEQEEIQLFQRVQELEKQILNNIQESDAFKASHNGARDDNIERRRHILMMDYSNTKRHAKCQLQARVDAVQQRLIELCESEASLKAQNAVEAVAVVEHELAKTLGEYRQMNGLLEKINANSTPNTSVSSSETRARSLTEGGASNLSLNRSLPVGEPVNGCHGDSMSVPKHMERRLPSVEFQMLNEVLSQEHARPKALPGKPLPIDGQTTEPTGYDPFDWLAASETDPTLGQFPGQASQLTAQAAHDHQPHLNGCTDIPMSPMQTDLSSRCSTPLRPPQADPNSVANPGLTAGDFFLEDVLISQNMDTTFPSFGGHPSSASMTEQILTPNTQTALFQYINTADVVVNMETDNDVFAP